MSYRISIIPFEKLSSIEKEWRRLESGEDMTYFQSYDWNCMLKNYLVEGVKSIENIVCSIYNDNGDMELIAPIMVLKHNYKVINKKGFYFIGMGGWSDYLNIIYKRFDSEAFEFLIAELTKKYDLSEFHLSQLLQESALYCYLTKKKHLTKDAVNTSVILTLPASLDEYHKLLSKHSKQNIRTAKNRLAKDGYDVEYSFCDDDDVDKGECARMRAARLPKKNYQPNAVKRLLLKLYACLSIKYPQYLPFYSDSNSRIMASRTNGKLRSFFNYGVSNHLKTIYIMAVGTDTEFERYSPGVLLMYAFICDAIEKKDLKYIDFTRGDEKYKYALGGENHYLHSVTFLNDK